MWNAGICCQKIVISFLCPYQVAQNKPLFARLPRLRLCDSDIKWAALPCHFGDGHKPLAYLSHPLVSASRRLSICLPPPSRNPTRWKHTRERKKNVYFPIASVRATRDASYTCRVLFVPPLLQRMDATILLLAAGAWSDLKTLTLEERRVHVNMADLTSFFTGFGSFTHSRCLLSWRLPYQFITSSQSLHPFLSAFPPPITAPSPKLIPTPSAPPPHHLAASFTFT